MRVVPVVFAVLVASPAFAAPPLFPKPLHLVRRVEDPISKNAESLDEYCYGNRIVTVRGKRVIIADYAAQELTEIDRAAATYSVTRFDEIAKAATRLTPPAGARAASASTKVTALGMKNGFDAYEITRGAATIEVGIDRAHLLSREAVEALLGAAYPNTRRAEHDAVLEAAAGRTGGRVAAQSAEQPQYGLPVEQTVTYSMEGTTLRFHTSVVRADAELVPQELLIIPAGAALVESRLTRIGHELQDVETLPARKR